MKRCIKNLSEKQKQWLWFIGLWTASLLTVVTIGYAIKLIMFAI
jgi:hypothetical protein